MQKELNCYINGQWAVAQGKEMFDLINPVTEEKTLSYRLGNEADVDNAVSCARKAFVGYSQSTREERVNILQNIVANLEKRKDELSHAISLEMGAPRWFAEKVQAALALGHAQITLKALQDYQFEKVAGTNLIKFVPIGVCGLITPWNWPAALIMCKMLPAIATGCTVVLKPSEDTPLSAAVIAEVMHESGVPAGVFNMVYGNGPTVGKALSGHPDINCISFTGSTRAGIDIAINAAPSVKRVVQELGGKSPNIILPSADIGAKVKAGIKGLMSNAGQTCSAPSRMIVPKNKMKDVKKAVADTIEKMQPGRPESGSFMGPVINASQYERIQAYIKSGIDEGASVLAGGPGKPDGLEKGYFIKPTVFADTTPKMKIVREEIFGPVLVIQEYDDVTQAIELAINTDYGLAAYVQGGDMQEVVKVAEQIPAGQVYCNTSGEFADLTMPFGGFKKSGNGREWGAIAFADYLETKAIIGCFPKEKK